MSTQSDSEEQAIQQEVAAWYHQQALELPSEKLDQAVLQLAQTHAQAKAQSKAPDSTSVKFVPRWRRHPWGLSSAASLVLVVGLVLLNRSHVDDSAIESSPLTMATEPAVVMQPRMAMAAKAPMSNGDAEVLARIQAEAHIQAERQAKSMQSAQAESQQQAKVAAAALVNTATDAVSETSAASAPLLSPLVSPELTPELIQQLRGDLAHWERLIQQDKPQAIKFEQALLQDYAGIITGMNVTEKSEKTPVTKAEDYSASDDVLNDDAVNPSVVNDGSVSDKASKKGQAAQELQQQFISLQQRFTALQKKLHGKQLKDE